MMSAQPIVRRKLADEVRDRLLSLIRTGEFSPGDHLPSERDLMSRFAVGRPAVREALQSLATAGLIEIVQGERARVAVPDAGAIVSRIGQTMLHLLHSSPTTLEHLKQARILFEIGMVRMAAQNATAADVERLRTSLEAQRSAMNNSTEFVRGDMAFHTAIASVSGNSVYAVLSEAMLDWLFHFQRELLRLPGSEFITMAEHERLLVAIAAHDVDEAERAMFEHLTRASERYQILVDAMARRALLNHQ